MSFQLQNFHLFLITKPWKLC